MRQLLVLLLLFVFVGTSHAWLPKFIRDSSAYQGDSVTINIGSGTIRDLTCQTLTISDTSGINDSLEYFSYDGVNYEVDLSTSLNIMGHLNVAGTATFIQDVGAPGSGEGNVITIKCLGTDNFALAKLKIDSSVGVANEGTYIEFLNDGTKEGEIRMKVDGAMAFVNSNYSTTARILTLEVCGGVAVLARSEAQLKALDPTKAGLQFYDSTNKALVISTGTATGAFGFLTDGSLAPTGW